jgi:protein disulfide-isomerase A6
MLLGALILGVRSDYVEITSKNVKETIGGPSPILVKFYLEKCGHCKAMAEDFAEAAVAFGTNVTFGGVLCATEKKICNAHKAKGFPTIKLFLAGQKKGIEYSGPRSADSFCDFVENYTTFRARRPPRYTTDLHPLNFDEAVNRTKCLFVTFYAPGCGHCKAFLPQFRLAAKAFLPDNVTFGLVNCGQYHDFCQAYAPSGYPTVKGWANGVPSQFEGQRTVARQAAFINALCGTERGEDGLLANGAGVIPAASDVAQELIAAADPAPFVAKLRAIPGAAAYVKAAERFIAKGADQIPKDLATMANILAAQKSSWKVLDDVKRRYNVFGEFQPRPAASPTPEPSAEPKQTKQPIDPIGSGPPDEAPSSGAKADNAL